MYGYREVSKEDLAGYKLLHSRRKYRISRFAIICVKCKYLSASYDDMWLANQVFVRRKHTKNMGADHIMEIVDTGSLSEKRMTDKF